MVALIGIVICITLGIQLIGEGEVTDKFITSNIAGFPKYYLVLNDEKDIEVNEQNYYKYEIGDEYP